MAIAALVMSAGSSFAGSFDRSPRSYDAAVNNVLTEVQHPLRFRLASCSQGIRVKCRFTSEHVSVLVEGWIIPARISKITLEADLMRDEPGSDPLAIVSDAVSAFGATLVAFDPRLPQERRVMFVTEMFTTALYTGRSEGRGTDAQYSLTFDEAASGLLTIAITPAGKPPRTVGLARLTYRNESGP